MRQINRRDRILMSRRKRKRQQDNRPRPFRRTSQGCLGMLLTTVIISLIFVGLGSAAFVGVYRSYAASLPDVSAIEYEQEVFETVRIYDRTGDFLLYESVDAQRGDRRFMPLEQISPWVGIAAVALEDESFYANPGINVRGLFRAFYSNLRGGSVQGGSSITQQLIKNVIIDPTERVEQSYARKIKEVILATEVTRKYDKDKILEWYLNYNFYGNLANGVEAASQVYFGKSSSELNLAEAAMLAPIPQFPALNPINNPEDAKTRQGVTLQRMVAAGFITQDQANEAFAEELELRKSVAERFDILTAPHFALYVLGQIENEFNTPDDPYFIWRNGLEIYTTLDVDLQKHAEQVAREQVALLDEQGKNASNAAVVSIKNDTGEIMAMVGSLDYNNEEIDGQVNVATAERQPGSSFKPYVYMTALQQGLNPATMIMDVDTVFPQADGSTYRPENYDRTYHGPTSLRNSLARSYNIPAIKIMQDVGVANALRTAHRMGINGLSRGLNFYGLNLVLGGGEVTLLDHTYAYSVWGNNGVMVGDPISLEDQRTGFRTLNPVSVLLVQDNNGNTIKQYNNESLAAERIISSEIAYVMADVMSDDTARAPAFGAGTDLTLPDRRAAAKTGTTNGFKDNWTMGFTPDLTTGVWVGNTDNESMKDVTGLSGAAPIWNSVMQKYHQGKPERWFSRPGAITNRVVCTPSGLLPSDTCPDSNRRGEIFVAGTEPTLQDNIWQAFDIDNATGELATIYTQPQFRETKFFQILPQEAADWVRDSGLLQPPTGSSGGLRAEDFSPDAAIIDPPPGGYGGGIFVISGNARGGTYRIDFGPGDNPQEWRATTPDITQDVFGGPLGSMNSEGLPEGPYTLRLQVRRADGTIENRTSITVDNTPPEVTISEPKQNQLYVMEEDEQININVLPEDRWAIDRVEFFIDGTAFVTTTVAPYNERWPITMQDIGQVEAPETRNWPGIESEFDDVTPGRIRPIGEGGFAAVRTSGGAYLEQHKFKARVYDGAGNMTESDEITVYVRHEPRDDE